MERIARDPVDPLEPVPVEARRYRDAVSRFPTGVTVVTARLAGQHQARTVSSFTSVSLEPVMVVVSISRRARLHEVMLAAGEWGVSVLGANQQHISQLFARSDRLTADGLAVVPHHFGPITGAVLLDEAPATFECRTAAVYDGGDHSLVLGEVLALALPHPDLGPLIYHRGDYHHLT